MFFVNENTVNKLFFQTALLLKERPITSSRNGDVRKVNNLDICLQDPTHRHLYLKGRKNNIISCMAETIWVLAGEDKIDPFLSFFLPRAKDYSDDGVTWGGAYGPRLYGSNQINNILQNIEKEGLETRKNVIGIWNPSDTNDSRRDSKDIPCNTCMWFWAEDNELNLKVQSRSGDIVWGLLNINIFEWTVFQEIILNLINNNFNCDLRLGKYYHGCIDAHYYLSLESQIDDVLNNKSNEFQMFFNTDPISLGKSIKSSYGLKSFFSEILRFLSNVIETNYYNFDVIEEVFEKYKVPVKGNTLYQYCFLVFSYIVNKKHGYLNKNVTLSDDICEALRYCKFINWGK